jgi:hypothetical protein
MRVAQGLDTDGGGEETEADAAAPAAEAAASAEGGEIVQSPIHPSLTPVHPATITHAPCTPPAFIPYLSCVRLALTG